MSSLLRQIVTLGIAVFLFSFLFFPFFNGKTIFFFKLYILKGLNLLDILATY